MFQFSAAWCFRSIPARDGCRWLAQNGRKMDVSTLKRTDLVGPMVQYYFNLGMIVNC